MSFTNSRIALALTTASVCLLYGCATLLAPSQKIKLDNSAKNSTVFINGQSALAGKESRVLRKMPLLVTSYREGHRASSVIIQPKKFNTAIPVVDGTLGVVALAVSPEGGRASTAASLGLYVLLDLLIMPKKHGEVKVGDMTKLPVNSIAGFRLWSGKGLDTLTIADQNQVSYASLKKYVAQTNGVKTEVKEKSRMDTLSISALVDDYLETMGYQKENENLFNDYEQNLILDAEMNSLDFHYMGYYCHHREIKIRWIVRDLFGKKLYETSVRGVSQPFANDVRGASESYRDAVLDALLALLADPGFVELRDQVGAVHRSAFESMNEIELRGSSSKGTAQMDQLAHAQVTLLNKTSHFSGSLVSPDGYILTSYRSKGQLESLTVLFSNGKKKVATVVRVDPFTSTALLKADTIGTASFRLLPKKTVEVGDDVIAVSTPVFRELGQSISKGIVSGERLENQVTYYQTDARISRGSAGSPLLNQKGELIGVITEKLSGRGVEGLSFAVSSADILEKLKLNYSN